MGGGGKKEITATYIHENIGYGTYTYTVEKAGYYLANVYAWGFGGLSVSLSITGHETKTKTGANSAIFLDFFGELNVGDTITLVSTHGGSQNAGFVFLYRFE